MADISRPGSPRLTRRGFGGVLGAAVGAAVVGGSLAACSKEAPQVALGAERITYGPGAEQFAELSRPEGTSRGVVVIIHGGFWLPQYSLQLGRPLAEDLVARGWTTLNIEYRRVGSGGGYPATLDDVSAAIDQLADSSVDLSTVIALGHSAGGTLAVWAAGRQRLDRWSGARVPLTHVVSQAGVLDLEDAVTLGLGEGAVQGWLGGTPETIPEVYADADPGRQIPLDVPVWCLHGIDDSYVPYLQSRRYVDKALAEGADATLVSVVGDHFEVIDVTRDAWVRAVSVLDEIVPATPQ